MIRPFLSNRSITCSVRHHVGKDGPSPLPTPNLEGRRSSETADRWPVEDAAARSKGA